ncbi:MAG: MFS transporter [Pseudomonadota bacterium]
MTLLPLLAAAGVLRSVTGGKVPRVDDPTPAPLASSTAEGAVAQAESAAAGESPAPPRYAYVVLGASLFMMVAGTGSVYLLVSALKPIAAEFDWPRTVPSVAYALQYLGGGLGGILMGYWLDRAGMARPACLGALMIGIGGCLTYYVQQDWHLYTIYGVMMGLVGRATLFSPLMVNITHWFEHRRGMAVGIVGSGQAIAGAGWPPLFQYGIATIGWRETSLYYGCFVLLTMVPLSLAFIPKPPASKAASKDASESAAPLPISPFAFTAVLCAAIVGCCVAMSLPLAHLLSHASDIGYDPRHGGNLLSVMLLAAAVSSMFGIGFLSSRLGALRGLMIFSATQAVMLGVMASVDSLTGLYVVAFLFGLGYGGILPSYPVVIREHLKSQGVGARTGLVVFFGTIGMALGSGLGGVSFDQTGGYAPAFYAGVVFNVANLVLLGWLALRLRRPPAPTPVPVPA